jgi:putative ABC transport system substrate-binding protein
VRRRDIGRGLAGAAALAGAAILTKFSRPLDAQERAKIPRVGYLSPESPASHEMADLFRDGLKLLGYVEGQTIQIEYRWGAGQFNRLPALARELVDLKVDIIAAAFTQASLAAKAATRTIPIVIAGVGDPVGSGLVASLAHPGGNITGTSSLALDIVGKQLQMLEQVVPQASHVAVLWNPANTTYQTLALQQAELAARASGVELQVLAARGLSDFDAAFAAISAKDAKALLILADSMFGQHRGRLVDLARDNRLPGIGQSPDFARLGLLMAYGPSNDQAYKRAAAYVDRILKGATPDDLPVEQPTKFDLVINLKTAKALGLTVPLFLLAQAEEVIE